MSKISVLLYSKYSPSSKGILDLISSAGEKFAVFCNLRILCIDNSEIRKLILKDTKIKIAVVPTILVVYANGTVEKYEGKTAIEWCYSIIQNLQPKIMEKTPISQSIEEEIVQEPLPVKKIKKSAKKVKKIEIDPPEEIESETIEENTPIDQLEEEEEKTHRPDGKVNTASIIARAQSLQQQREQLEKKEGKSNLPRSQRI